MRWAAAAFLLVGLASMAPQGLVAIMHVFVPVGESARNKLAKKLDCGSSLLAEGLAAWTICWLVVAPLWVLVAVFGYGILFG
jgi:hypothetical protein